MVPGSPDEGSLDSNLAEMIGRARALAPVIEDGALASEQSATLVPKTVEALRDSGLVRAFLPKELGGLELPPSALVQIVEEVARLDGSAGWCLGMNGVVGGICAAALPDEGIERVYASRSSSTSGAADAPERVLMAGGFPPQGRAVREGDAWRVSADMRFGSGIRHADYVACTAIEFEGDAPIMDGAMPRMRTFVVPREEVRITDNWDVSGLQGTGSCDYHLDDQLLPEALSFTSSSLVPRRGFELYSLPILTVANAPHAGFALGVGTRALEEIAEHAGWRHRLASSAPLAERGSFQQGFGRARTRLLAARAFVLESFDALAAARTKDDLPLELRANMTAATTNAYESAQEAALFAFRVAGGPAIYRKGRLQRTLRDIQAGSQHIVPSEESWERVAQAWLGVGEPMML